MAETNPQDVLALVGLTRPGDSEQELINEAIMHTWGAAYEKAISVFSTGVSVLPNLGSAEMTNAGDGGIMPAPVVRDAATRPRQRRPSSFPRRSFDPPMQAQVLAAIGLHRGDVIDPVGLVAHLKEDQFRPGEDIAKTVHKTLASLAALKGARIFRVAPGKYLYPMTGQKFDAREVGKHKRGAGYTHGGAMAGKLIEVLEASDGRALTIAEVASRAHESKRVASVGTTLAFMARARPDVSRVGRGIYQYHVHTAGDAVTTG